MQRGTKAERKNGATRRLASSHVFAVSVVRIREIISSRDRSRGFARGGEKVEHPSGLTVKSRFRYSAQKERPGVSAGLNTKVIARPCVTCTSINVAVYVGYVGCHTCTRGPRVYCRVRGTIPPHVCGIPLIPPPLSRTFCILRTPGRAALERIARVQRFSLARASRRPRGVRECRRGEADARFLSSRN